MIEIRPLPCFLPGLRMMGALRSLPWAIWLDSGLPAATAGRYELCMAAPTLTLVSHGGEAVLQDADGKVLETTSDPLALLRGLLLERRVAPMAPPFCGGAAGYFGYDLGLRLQGVAPRPRPSPLPEMAVGIYDWALISDNVERRTWWVGRRQARAALPMLEERLRAGPEPSDHFAIDAADLSVAPEWLGYRAAFARVRDYLYDGDCYQVNLARRFRVGCRGDPWAAYRRLRAISPAPYSAYLSLPFADILSTSPERFLLLQDGQVETRPIKGTRPRRLDAAADAAEIAALRNSVKDRAENVMIVDLLRNDLGKVCRPGSIEVARLFEIESYASVHHMVSTVRGRLREELGAVDLLTACLPGGSITGAPKRRAMEIIDELESARRGVYCGTIGYLSDDGRMDTNIAIRTAVCMNGEMSYWAGGGLVADSGAESEFEETLHKAKPFLDLVAVPGIRE
jgi:para-aminobenzoate synthetase component 1